MTDLAEFLLARIAEDQKWARAAAKFHPTPWRLDPEVQTTMEVGRWLADASDEGVLVANGDAAARHIVRHDPARVLAECAAKRAIVELHGQYGDPLSADYGDGAPDLAADTLRLLALPYAEHPGYRPEWSPTG